ncbi:MAG: hypothetical protein HW391_2030 [Chloroflexi bacterium]|nr:hypothetical protein [Chloroflexota bacterium]
MQYGQCDGRLEKGERCDRSVGHRPPCRPTRAQRRALRQIELRQIESQSLRGSVVRCDACAQAVSA